MNYSLCMSIICFLRPFRVSALSELLATSLVSARGARSERERVEKSI